MTRVSNIVNILRIAVGADEEILFPFTFPCTLKAAGLENQTTSASYGILELQRKGTTERIALIPSEIFYQYWNGAAAVLYSDAMRVVRASNLSIEVDGRFEVRGVMHLCNANDVLKMRLLIEFDDKVGVKK